MKDIFNEVKKLSGYVKEQSRHNKERISEREESVEKISQNEAQRKDPKRIFYYNPYLHGDMYS